MCHTALTTRVHIVPTWSVSNDWAWSPPWGFGHLGIKFWNWPLLTGEFRAEVADLLGHRTVYPRGKV